MRTRDSEFDAGYDADPGERAIEWIKAAHPGAQDRLAENPELAATLEAVVVASPWLARLCVTDPFALDVLSDLDRPSSASANEAAEADVYERLRRSKDLGILRVAARDLLGLDPLEEVGRSLSSLAEMLLGEAIAATAEPSAGLVVVALGKLGAAELNYASDIDLVLVSPDVATGRPDGSGSESTVDPRPFVELARLAWRIDLDLRPEGRSGPMVRSLESYRAYWSRWAEAWEFQALLKARPVAGDAALGALFAGSAAEQVWGRPFGADELRQLRNMKARSESELSRRNLLDREIKRGRGGIRDIEFSIQLLQLVHGRNDPALRRAATLDALAALASGGYIDVDDAQQLESAYRFLRTVEHRLQLYEGQQVYTLPRTAAGRSRLALVLGYRHDGIRSAEQQFDEDLRRHRTAARTIHERLFFRPLLEAFTGPDASGGSLSDQVLSERLAAFGFADANRAGQAVAELTRGISRVSQLMQRTLPLLLDWLSVSPDPDLGLLGLRVLAGGSQSRDRLVAVCRESPNGARQLCQLLGTGPRFARTFQRHPEALTGLASGTFTDRSSPEDLRARASHQFRWRSGEGSNEVGLRQFTDVERVRIAAREVLDLDDHEAVGRALTELADAVIAAALDRISPSVPLAIIGMGRVGGYEASYDSDLDLLLVWDAEVGAGGSASGSPSGSAAAAAEASAVALTRLIGGSTPATGAYKVDLNLRPEGRQGATARSLGAYEAYYERWARPWERQALLRGRFVAGDARVGEAFARVVRRFVWERPLTAEDVTEIRRTKARMEKERLPAGEDPKFHLKLGPGSMSDVEWTVQLLQLQNQVKATGTLEAIDALVAAGGLDPDDAAVLGEAYRFCARTRNRLSLTRDIPGDSLPVTGPALSTLARSLGLTAPGLRSEYTRVTRRARKVMERLFYDV